MLLLLFWVAPISEAKAQVHFVKSLDSALQQSKSSGKRMFLEYYNEDCPHCKKLESVFADSVVSKFLNDSFVCTRINSKYLTPEQENFLNGYRIFIRSVPVFLFFYPDQRFCHYASPKQSAENVLSICHTALDSNHSTSSFQRRYTGGERSLKFLFEYAEWADLQMNDSLRSVLSDELYRIFPEKKLGSKKSFIILKNSVVTVSNGFFQYWYKHRNELDELKPDYSAADMQSVLQNILIGDMVSSSKRNYSLAQLAQMKQMYLNLKLGAFPDRIVWEQEVKELLRLKRYTEAVSLVKNVADSQLSVMSAMYIYRRASERFDTEESATQLKVALDAFQFKGKGASDSAEWYLVLGINAAYRKECSRSEQYLNRAEYLYIQQHKNFADNKRYFALCRF